MTINGYGQKRVSELKMSDTCYQVLVKHGCMVIPRELEGVGNWYLPIRFYPEDDIYSEKHGWYQVKEGRMVFPTVEQAMIFAHDKAIRELGENINLKYTRSAIKQFYLNNVYNDVDIGMTFVVDNVNAITEHVISENRFEYELGNNGEQECDEIIKEFHEKYMVPTDTLQEFLKKIGWINK